MTSYVTEISGGIREPSELQVMHKHPMTEPEMKAEAAQLGGSGPRPDQNPERNQSMSTPTTEKPVTRQEHAAGPRLPTRAELYRATEATAATMKDPGANVQDRYRAAEKEAATLHAFEQRHGNQAKADLERYRDVEKEAGLWRPRKSRSGTTSAAPSRKSPSMTSPSS